jgi:hypothetical protein
MDFLDKKIVEVRSVSNRLFVFHIQLFLLGTPTSLIA